MTSEWQFCAVCGRPLERIAEQRWAHGRMLMGNEPDDHLAVPVDRSALTPVRRCDVCDADSVTWAIHAKTFSMPAPNDNQTSVGGWSFCDPCGKAMTEVIATRNVSPLVTRAAEHGPIAMNDAGVDYLRRLFAKLLVNRLGEVIAFTEDLELDGTP